MDIFAKISEGKYSMKHKEWDSVSDEAKDLVTKMLEMNPKKRLSAQKCLNHEWFEIAEKLKGEEGDALDLDLLQNLKEFKSTSMLKKTAMSVLVKLLTAKEIGKLKKQFEAIDTDFTGYIDAEELSTAMKKSNLNVPAKEIDKIISEIDYKGNNQINYSEFIAATLKTK